MLELVIDLLVLLVCLVIIGEPLRLIISHFTKLFGNLDLLQVTIIDVYLGGLIIYVVALLPFHLINSLMMWALLLLSAFVTSIFYLTRIYKRFRIPRRSDVFCYAIVLAFFLSALLLEAAPTTNFLLGSVHDTSLSALFTEVIFENQQIPLTLQPYLPEGIIYPQGFFVIAAYTHLILDLPIAEIPLVITPLFQALSVLGVYYLGRTLLNRKLAISLAFIFAFAAPWPKFVTWGSNAFVFGFPLFFICLSLMYNLKYSQTHGVNKTDLLTIGILYGYLAAIHLMIFVALIASMFIWILINILHYGWQSIRRELVYFLTVTIVSVVPIGVFAYRAIMWYSYPSHNIGVPVDVTIQPPSLPETNRVTSFITEPINEYPWLAVEVFVLVAIGMLLMIHYYRRRELGAVTASIQVSGVFALGCLSVLFISLLQYIIPLLIVFIGESIRYGILLNIAVYLSLGVFFVLIHHFLEEYEHKKEKAAKKQMKTLRRYLPALLVFSLISVPMVCNSVIYDVQTLTNQYGLWAVTKQDDLMLMQWMRGNLPANATILINPDDAGGFIPAVANYRVVYPFTISRDSRTYLTLVTLITQMIFNSTTYDLMKDLNVTHVFVGSSAVLNNQSLWNPAPMLIDPHFELIKEIGSSYLFKFSI